MRIADTSGALGFLGRASFDVCIGELHCLLAARECSARVTEVRLRNGEGLLVRDHGPNSFIDRVVVDVVRESQWRGHDHPAGHKPRAPGQNAG